MITIDGSQGEGGGQILRTAVGLSLVTGQPCTIDNIRAGRPKPGLRQQHLAAVHAAAEVGSARLAGAELGSMRLVFEPAAVRPGQYRFAVSTAGSATLVLQTVLPALMVADGPSSLVLEGGTHNPWAPPYDFLERAFAPLVARMGPRLDMRLKRPGFYPAGGGQFSVGIEPARPLGRIELLERGEVRRQTARAIVSRLPLSIAERELRVVRKRLRLDEQHTTAEAVDSRGPGNALIVAVACEHVTEVFTAFGQRGVPAEQVASGLVQEVKQYLSADVPVGEYLADQLLIPMALAGGGVIRSTRPTAHTTTNIEVVRRFLPVDVAVDKIARDAWQIAVQRRP